MSLQNTDLFIVERAGARYRFTATQLKAFLGTNYIVADITARDALTGLVASDEVYVVDASANPTVDLGGAKYIWDGAAFLKIAEDESFDVTVAPTNLGWSPTPTGGAVTNTSGDNANLTLADATNAGLMSPAAFTSIHNPATLGGTTATNPLTLTGQELAFSIAQLDPLP